MQQGGKALSSQTLHLRAEPFPAVLICKQGNEAGKRLCHPYSCSSGLRLGEGDVLGSLVPSEPCVGSVSCPDRVPVPRTVLLLNRSEVHSEFLSIAQRLSSSEPPQHSTLVLLLQHLYQANFGSCCDLDRLQHLLKVGWGKAHPGVPREKCRVLGCWVCYPK